MGLRGKGSRQATCLVRANCTLRRKLLYGISPKTNSVSPEIRGSGPRAFQLYCDLARVGFDTLLADISLYWFGNEINGSLRLYKKIRLSPLTFNPGERVVPPLGVALFPPELPMPPRPWVERVFDVRRWTLYVPGRSLRRTRTARLARRGYSRLLPVLSRRSLKTPSNQKSALN